MGEVRAYYNEIDRDAVHVLRSLIADGLIADGDVDDRSIVDVRSEELAGYTQCHFFAGAGLWSVAARLAGWPDDRPLWTGSCPCQPFSAAGRGLGTDDPRHLWPDFFRLIRARRPPVVMGEQVAGAPGYGWFDGVRSDLAGEDFASRTVDIPVCAVDGPHIRQRLYWITVANAGCVSNEPWVRPREASSSACSHEGETRQRERSGLDDRLFAGSLVNASRVRRGEGRPEPELRSGRPTAAIADAPGVALANPNCTRPATIGRDPGEVSGLPPAQRRAEDDAALSRGIHGAADDGMAQPEHGRCEGGHQEGRGSGAAYAPDRGHGRNGSAWAGAEWLFCHDGKARRTEPGIRLLVDGMAGRVPAWRLAGNSISPVLAAEVIGAFLDIEREAA